MSVDRYASIIVVLLLCGACFASDSTSDSEDKEPGDLPPNVVGRLERVSQLKIRVAVEELRALGTLAEDLSIVNGYYPCSPGRPESVPRKLEGDLDERALRRLPDVDPWGTHYIYWCEGSNYFIVSYGPDRKPGTDYDAFSSSYQYLGWNAVCNHQDDLVFENGKLCE
jgi:hypothetical protein